MKKYWILWLIWTLIPGCSLLLPHLLDGIFTANSALNGIIFINEVSADNPDADDWIEFYNSNTQAVNLSGFFLSDESTNLSKWHFPATTYIAGNSYLVVVCDGTGAEGNADFKLQAGTEALYLITPDQETIIDSLLVIPATGTASYGRATDGDGSWVIFPDPTKGSSN